MLRVALARFGAVAPADAGRVVDDLIRQGEALTPDGARIRLMAFGTRTARSAKAHHAVMSLGHIGRYLARLAEEHWDAVKVMRFGNDVFALLALLEKAERFDDEEEA